MYLAAIIVILIISALLVLTILMQNSKGGGVNQAMGGASTQLMGVQKTGDILEKLTWGFAISILALCLSTSFLIDKGDGQNTLETETIRRANEETVQTPQQAPAQQTPAQPETPAK